MRATLTSPILRRLALAAALLLGAGGAASAQSRVDCDILLSVCRSECAENCADPYAPSCLKACAGDRGCIEDYVLCRGDAGLPEAKAPAWTAERAPGVEAPSAPEAPPPAARVMSLDQPAPGGPLDGRIFFLTRAESEPDALFYGYMVIGPKVSQARRRAVIEGLACRLELVTAETAASVDRLGLVTIPALRDPSGETAGPREMLDAYDFQRAERWMRAAGFSVGEAFDADTAVLFVGSRAKRSRQLDAVLLPGPDADLDPVVADASALTPRYLERWTAEIVEGVENGSIRSRQDLQTLMETHSWIESATAPIASLLRLSPAQAAPPPSDCR